MADSTRLAWADTLAHRLERRNIVFPPLIENVRAVIETEARRFRKDERLRYLPWNRLEAPFTILSEKGGAAGTDRFPFPEGIALLWDHGRWRLPTRSAGMTITELDLESGSSRPDLLDALTAFDRTFEQRSARHPYWTLNQAAAPRILVVDLAPGERLTLNVGYATDRLAQGESLHAQIFLRVGAGAQLHLRDWTKGVPAPQSLFTQCVRVALEAEASLFAESVTETPHEHRHFSFFEVLQKGGSTSRIGFAGTAAGIARRDCWVALEGPRAESRIGAFSTVSRGGFQELHVDTLHNAGRTKSRQIELNLARGGGRSIYRGRILVAKGAGGTESHQKMRAVPLDPDATALVEPYLEIYNDDVVCTHGAASGNVDEESLFYLESRGLSPERAQRLILEGFLNDITGSLGADERSWLLARASEMLATL